MAFAWLTAFGEDRDIGEVAAATGFPASTLRYYEDEGLLPAPDRTPSGQRVYRDAHVARLRFMARQTVGVAPKGDRRADPVR